MDYFMNKGQCRVCSKMFCCFEHQRKHERTSHDESADWLDVFPLRCRRCYKNMNNIRDMKSKCIHQFNTGTMSVKHVIKSSSSGLIPMKLNRKRPGDTFISESANPKKICTNDTGINRKKIKAFRRNRKSKIVSPRVILIDLNDIQVTDDLISAMFSPQFNISYKILTSDVKSSTPLYDDKENLPVIAVLEQNDISTYKTPEVVKNSSLIVISALKKNFTPRESIVKNNNSKIKTNSRRVTFEEEKTPSTDESERSVYGTPELKLESKDIVNILNDEIAESPEVEVSFYGLFDSNILSVGDSTEVESENSNKSYENDEKKDCAAILELVKNVGLTVYGIPRLICKACNWSLSVIGQRKRNEYSSPEKSIFSIGSLENDQDLKRRPLSSHWVTTRSLMRKPLSSYKRNSAEN